MITPSHAAAQPLLRFGLIAGPFYLAIGIAQGLVREGFDFARHPLSVLANGPGGWIQAANFALTGLMVIAASVGVGRVLRPTSRAAGAFLGVYGLCILLASVLTADPVDGFPVGTPLGFPTSMTTFGMLHFVAGALGFLCLGVSCLVASRALSRRGASGLSRFSLLAGVVVLVGFFGAPAVPSLMIVGIWTSVVMGWLWLAVLSLRLPALPSA